MDLSLAPQGHVCPRASGPPIHTDTNLFRKESPLAAPHNATSMGRGQGTAASLRVRDGSPRFCGIAVTAINNFQVPYFEVCSFLVDG